MAAVVTVVPAGDDAGELVDPLHEDAAEEAAVAVDVLGADDVDLFGEGVTDFFS